MSQSKYVLLDRDGVINEDSDLYIKSAREWKPIQGSLEAIALLNKNGYKTVVITNQSGLYRGYFGFADLEKIHIKMRQLVKEKGGKIDAIYFCPHGPDEGCTCRKPKPGLFEKFSNDKNVRLENVPFVGDTLSDIEAGRTVGAKPLLVKTGKGKKTLLENPNLNIPVFENLYEAAKFIISGK